MADGKTYWWAKDAQWLQRDGIVELGTEFGAAGPLLLDALCGMAKLENDAGHVFTGYVALARVAFTDPDVCRQVIERAVEIGVLDDFEPADDGRRFSVRVSGWQADQKKGRAADRDAQRRARTKTAALEAKPASSASDATERGNSRPLTHTHAPVGTGQDRTEQNTSSLRSEEPQTPMSSAPRSTPADDQRAVVAELFAHWQTVCQHPQAKPTPERLRAIRARLRDGYTAAQVRQAIDGAARHPFIDQRGKRHDDLTLICRNGSKLEDFADRANRPPSGHPAGPAGRPSRQATALAGLLANEQTINERQAA